MPALSAVAKPFSPESDSHILFLTQKFIFLEQLYIPAMQSKNSASLLIQLQTSFNLLFEEQKLYLSTADMSNSSVTNISPSFVTSPHFDPAISINSSNSNNLTPRKLKKQQRGAIWKLKKLSTDPMKLQPQTVLANPDLVSESSSSSNQIFNHSSKSNINSHLVSKPTENSFQSSPPNLHSTTESTVDVPPIPSSAVNTPSVSNVASATSTVKIQSVSNVTHVPLHIQEGEYTGDLTVKGIRHGRGKMKYTVEPYLDHSYEGTWKFDKFYGNGKYTWSDGHSYEGKWFNGLMHGRGTFTFLDGSVYSGDFQNDDFNGIGTH